MIQLDIVPLALAILAGVSFLYLHATWQGRRDAVAMPALVVGKRLKSENREVFFFLRVRLDPRMSDGREAEILVGAPCWKGLEDRDGVEVLATPGRPPFVFWSPLIWSADAEALPPYPALAVVFGVLAVALAAAAV